MDNALCGGSGATLTGNALKAVKAAIFMGDPHNRAGLPYNVGTCAAQGVRNPQRIDMSNANRLCSSLPVPLASSARPRTPASSSLTAMLLTHTAATATTPTLTSSTSTSTVPRLLPSSRPRLPHKRHDGAPLRVDETLFSLYIYSIDSRMPSSCRIHLYLLCKVRNAQSN
jgi:hypothetical protein